MIDLVMLVQNRPRLANQAIKSLINNTTEPWRMTIVDDGSGVVTANMLRSWARMEPERIAVLCNSTPMGPGQARNKGIEGSERRWGGRGDWLYLCDSDSYHKPSWDRALIEAWPVAEAFKMRVLAGYVHPYNQTNTQLNVEQVELHEKYAVGLFSWLWKWETWSEFGPFDPSPVANFSEDVALCHKIRLAGFRVGCIWPWMVVNCGLTGSNGKLSPGSELIYKQEIPEGVLVE